MSSIVTLWAAAQYSCYDLSASKGIERAVIGNFADPAVRGTLFGWYYAPVGIASIPADLLLGLLWQSRSAAATFAFAGCAGVVAAGLSHFKLAPQLAKLLPIIQRH